MKKSNRLLSFLLCCAMLIGLLPTAALAWTAPTLTGGNVAWNVQLSDEGVLTWNDMGSATYDIQVDETAMGGTVTKIQGISGTSYNLINRFKELKIENGTYYFYIKANDTDTTSGDISFKYVSPQDKLSAPLNLSWEGTIAKWNSVANATGYTVYLYTDDGYLQLTKTTTEPQYDWTTEAEDGRWFEVVATADNYRDSNPAEGPRYGTYSWTAPTLTGGNAEWNVTLSDDGMLRWNDMGSATYDISVDETAMGGTVTNIYNINTNAFNLINRFKELKLENGTYYFSIKANDTSATSGDISFKYVSPEAKLPAPQNLHWDGTVAKWDSVAGATEYAVTLYTSSGSVQLSKTTSETQYDWTTEATDGRWFEVVATADGSRDSNPAESPKYVVVSYSIGAYPYDATVFKTQAGGQVFMTTDAGAGEWSSDGYIKTATKGSTVTLNAMPATGYKFVEWRQGTAGATISTEANCQFTASEDKYLYAVFEAISTTEYQIELLIFDITYEATAGGTVKLETNKGSADGTNPKAYATEGTAVTITAVPAQGYEFVAWKKYTPHYATAFSTEATYTFTAEEPAVIPSDDPPLFLYAVFQETQPQATTYEINCVSHNLSSNETGGTVMLETDKGGTGYAASQQRYATENTNVRVLAVAEPGYQFVAWRKGSPGDANATVSTNTEYQFTATEAVWMYAVFEYTPECTVDCSVFDITGGINNGQSGVGGTVSIQTDKGSVEGATPLPIKATRNSSVTVNAVADSGYEFLGWKKESPYVQDFVATTASYTFDINEELYLYAVFQEATNVPDLAGSVTINGDAKFGSTLTATVTNTNNTGDLSYQWVRGTTNISGANSDTYTLVEADIGSTIKVVVTSSVESGSITSTATDTIEKADGSDAPTGLTGVAPTTDGGSDGKITGTAATMEYSTDSSFANGIVCPGTETTGLTAGTYYVRYKETATHKAGAYATVTVPDANVPATLTGTVTITGDAKYGSTLTAVVTGSNNTGTLSYQWVRDASNEITGATGQTYTIELENNINSTLKVIVTSSVQTGPIESEPTALVTRGDNPNVPTGLTGVAPATSGGYGKITGTTTAMEYSKYSDFSDSSTCGADATTALTPGTYYVRYRQTSTHFAGTNYATVVVPAYAGASTYEVTVTNGTATPSGAQAAGTSVTITAGAAPAGKQFKEWTGADNLTFTSGSKTTATATFTMPAQAVSVTAVYENISVTAYTITFDANGGTVTPTSGTTGADGKLVSLPTPSRSGYTFQGWFTAASGGTQVTAATVFDTDATVYAQWTSVSSGGVVTYPTTYLITVKKAQNGSVLASPIGATEGSTVAILVKPADGYSLATLTATDKQGSKLLLTKVSDTKYTFKMPASKVTVEGTFADENLFADVDQDVYYNEAIQWAVQMGITSGTAADTFSPDEPCTRAQMVTFLWRAAGSPEPAATACAFADVDLNSYYGKAVLWALEEGITVGTSAATFSPDATCTRGQMATFLCRMADGKPEGSSCAFADVAPDAYYAEAVQWAVEQGITVGTSATTFSPDALCTRGQTVTFLYRLLGK